jgi:sugar transferase (PEP-CTERM system associated)
LRTIQLFNHHIHSAYYWLVVVEGLLFALSFFLGSELYFFLDNARSQDHIAYAAVLQRSVIFALTTTASMAAMGLYKPHLREGANGILLRLMSAFLLTILAMSLIFYLLPDLYLWRGVFAHSVLMAFVIGLLTRWVFHALVVEEAQLKSRVLVLGAGERAAQALQYLRRDTDRLSFLFVGFVPMGEEEIRVVNEPVVRPEVALSEYVERHRIDRVVVALDNQRGTLPVDELAQCRFHGVEVVDLASFFEREAGKIMLNFVQPSWLVFSSGFNVSALSAFCKRLFDIGASFALLMLVWPVMLLAAVSIWIEDGFGAPIVYRQQRVGKNGRVFDLLKLRSMRVNAEKDGKARWADLNDSRITRVGKIIRRLRIDELPQIINILAGDMSLVGPRPERPEFVDQLAEQLPYYNVRHYIKPGIAGWAQLRYPYGASVEDARQKLQYELYYVKNHNLFLDFMILLTTAEVVVFGEGVR